MNIRKHTIRHYTSVEIITVLYSGELVLIVDCVATAGATREESELPNRNTCAVILCYNIPRRYIKVLVIVLTT